MKLQVSFIVLGVILCADCNGFSETMECPSVVMRCDWNASMSTDTHFLRHPVKMVIIGHTVTTECATFDTCTRGIKSIQNYHQNMKHWGDIAYK
ncbi:hypothetical protein DMENIID0001_062180 [Sergentomyia squamirostris]